MKFTLQQSGVLSFPVFQIMTNKEVKFAIKQEIMLQSVILSHAEQNALKSYLNVLDNDELFVDPCGKMLLSFGFSK